MHRRGGGKFRGGNRQIQGGQGGRFSDGKIRKKIINLSKIPHLDLFQNMIIAEVTTTTITIIISTKPVAVSVLRHRDDQVDP